MSDQRRGRPIDTYSGGTFHPLDPDPEDIRVRDVAHGLANTCRYGGQCQFYYSVATHSVYVSRELQREFGPEVQLYGLFHDAAEAYVTDVPRPVKDEVGEFEAIESDVLAAVWDHLGVESPSPEQWEAVMAADDRLFHYESDVLLDRFQPEAVPDRAYDLEPNDPTAARQSFLRRAGELLSVLDAPTPAVD